MAKIRFALYVNLRAAGDALRDGHKDVVVIDCGGQQKSTFRMLGLRPNLPECLTRLPGFCLHKILGTPEIRITSYVVHKSSQEVMETLRALKQ